MNYSCPGCSNTISHDLTGATSLSLRVTCAQCSKVLSLSDRRHTLVHCERASNEKQLANVVEMALVDGSIGKDESALLIKKMREFGVEEKILTEFVSRATEAFRQNDVAQVEELYSEDLQTYLTDNDLYDLQRFAQSTARVSTGQSILKRYRDDLVEMISHNAERFKGLARRWERIYDSSSESTEWDEILEDKNRCLATAAAHRSLRDEISSLSRPDLVAYLKAMASAGNHAW